MKSIKPFLWILLMAPMLSHAQITIEELGNGGKRFWVIYDQNTPIHSPNLVVFLHGYGASNPASYGGWIRDLVSAGNVVVFPKFQVGLFYPAERKFQRRADWAIHRAVKYLQDQKKLQIKQLSFVSHSIGGMIAANLSDLYGQSGEFKVGALILVQPGFKYMKQGEQETYDQIDPATEILLITGKMDVSSGDKFAKHLYASTPQVPDSKKHYFRLHPTSHEDELIRPTHKDPVCPDRLLDTGNKNLVICGSFWLCDTDAADEHVYWKLSRRLIECVNENKGDCNVFETQKQTEQLVLLDGGIPVVPITEIIE